MSIAENLAHIRSLLPAGTTLVAVSKTKPHAAILEAYAHGQRHFGENKVQELVDKYEALPQDIHWHMIGHVQTNKIKYFAPFVHLVHGVDRPKVLEELNKQAARCNRVIDCLLQVHIAQEESKFGFSPQELTDYLQSGALDGLPHVAVIGLMGMATFTDNNEQVAQEFAGLAALYNTLKEAHPAWTTLSMGMSGDWRLAVQEGSTMVRVGSAIFGERNYSGDSK